MSEIKRTETEEEILIKLKSEIDQIFAKLGMENSKGNLLEREVFNCLKECVFIAVKYPNTWQKGYLVAFARRYNLTRERIRVAFWRTTAESWKPSSIKILTEHFGYPIKLNFEIISKPHNAEFTILLADHLRAKYKIQPKEEVYEWPCTPIEMDESEDNSKDEFIDDEDFMTVDD